MLTLEGMNFVLELMNLPHIEESDAVWFFSDWEGEDRPLDKRFADLFAPHWGEG